MTILLNCLRCGDKAEMDPNDPAEPGMCMACFQKYMAVPLGAPAFRRFLRYQRHWIRHPTHKALTAALEAMEAVPHGSLDDAALARGEHNQTYWTGDRE